MNNPKVKYGDIYSANHTGHEVVICSLSEGDNKNLFYRVERDGYDFTVRLIEHLPKDMDSTKRKEAIKVFFKEIYILAKPLPAHTYFTVRIPYPFCSTTEGEWKKITKIINKELVYKDIPVEIWMTEVSEKC